MDIVIIDGQGGGFGRALIEALRAGGVTQEIVAVGTNALATSAMLRAGASAGAHGRKRRDRERRAGAYSGGSHRPCDGKQHAGRMQPGHGPRRGGKPGSQGAHPRCQMAGRTLRAFRKSRWPNT